MAPKIFKCPGCAGRFRIRKPPADGRITCPKCGRVSILRRPPASPAGAAGVGLAPGAKIVGHKILEHLGGNRFVAVYKASQVSMGRTVLFHVLRPEHAGDQGTRSRFFAEARSFARLNHPNLLSVFDMGEEGGVCFYTTEFASGGTLPAWLQTEAKISSKERLALATQIARALSYAETSGVKQVWLGPQDVLLTDKGDVRLQRVGVEQPLGDGGPEPILNALVRLVYVAVAGEDLPPGSRPPGAGGAAPLPMAKDPLGGRLNALVSKLLSEGGYGSVRQFTAEMEKLFESAHRRSTVDASAPGGVVPLRLKEARRGGVPMKKVLIGTLIGGALLGVTLFTILAWSHARRQEKEALALWQRAMEQIKRSDTRLESLRTLQTLARDYAGTRYGETASREGLPRAAELVIADYFNEAEAEFKDRPREREQAAAAIEGAAEKLEGILPGHRFIGQQKKVRLENVRLRYTKASARAWNEDYLERVEVFCRKRQFGNAVATVDDYREKWQGSSKLEEVMETGHGIIAEEASKAFDEAVKEFKGLIEEGRSADAREVMETVIRTYGLPEYEDRAKGYLADLLGPR